jgi:hypothetical protein
MECWRLAADLSNVRETDRVLASGSRKQATASLQLQIIYPNKKES